MDTVRLEPVDKPYPAEVADTLESMMPPGAEPIGLFRTVAHSPKMLAKLRASSMLGKVSLTLRQREILILRTTASCAAEYEWGVHVSFFAERVGFTRSGVSAVSFATPDESGLPEDEKVLLELVDSLSDQKTVPADVYETLQSQFSTEQMLEMIMLIGAYHTVSFLCNAFAIANEAGTPRFEDYMFSGAAS